MVAPWTRTSRPLAKKSDEELLLRIREDHSRACEHEFLKRYQPYINALGARMCRRYGFQRPDIEDAQQEASMDVLQAVVRLDAGTAPPGSIVRLILRLAAHSYIDSIRSFKRLESHYDRSIAAEDAADAHAQQAGHGADWILPPDRDEADPVYAACRHELAGVVHHQLLVLAPTDRTIVEQWMAAAHYAEIAARLDMSPEAVRHRVQRLRPILRARLGRSLGVDDAKGESP